ncbi:MAG: sulfite exporter TauE/SafE family protein [Phycisphaeraceae bacterium]|nr:sulfite exporter TauE/SafE family protein [Phycisphaeraceae bacterium]
MTALLLAVLAASLLGSSHCAGMCGAFVLFAVATPDDAPSVWRSRAMLNAAYNLGRLVTYSLLGAVAGLLGAGLDLGGSMVGAQRTAAVVAGAMMIGFGVVVLLRARGVRVGRLPVPGVVTRMVAGGHRAVADAAPINRAWTVGMLTTLLPCGWLYAFAITAAGTGSPLSGAAVMAIFWAGTLPVLAAVGIGAQALAGPLRSKLPVLTSLLLVGVGVYTVLGRMTLPTLARPQAAVSVETVDGRTIVRTSHDLPECCHGPSALEKP